MEEFTDVVAADATALVHAVRSRRISSEEVVSAHLQRIAASNPAINAIVTVRGEAALAEARAADAAVRAGDTLGPLHGVPFTAKDALDTAGTVTTRGSLLFCE